MSKKTNKKKEEKTIPSKVIRVEKKANFTIIDNLLLRSTNLSLKAIGLLCKILSLPDIWYYTIAGLAALCMESESAVKSALEELKKWGYLEVTKLMPNQTKSGHIEYVYVFKERSDIDIPLDDNNDKDASDETTESRTADYQDEDNQGTENLTLETQSVEIQATENQGQINTDDEVKTNQVLINQESIYQPLSALPQKAKNPNGRPMDGYISEQQIYSDIVKTNIDFPYFADWLGDENEAEEIVQMIVRQICSRKPTERICKQDFPREVVKSAMLKVNIFAVESAIELMRETENIRNYESYFISTLYNEANNMHFKANAEARSAENAVIRDFGGLYEYSQGEE